MKPPVDEHRTAAHARDRARRRLRRVTQLSIGLTVALGGAFAALAAGSTHPKKVVRVAVPRARVAVLVDAPAPPLVGGQSSAPTPSSAPVAPAAAPTPTYVSPVVVSGGS